MRASRSKTLSGTMVMVLVIAVCSLAFVSCGKGTSEDYRRVGAVLPLTGSAAVWGQNARRGMDLALDELNNSGAANQKIAVIYEDSRSDPKSAVSALQKLIAADHVQVVIGDIASSSVLAMAPIAESNKVVLLSPGASSPEISDAGEYIFRNWQSDALEGQIDAQFAYSNRGWRRVASLYVNNAYGTGLNKEFSKAFTALGGTIMASESFNQGAVDLRGQITRLLAIKMDAIYLPGYPPEMAVALKQMKELKLTAPILSVQAFDDPEILARAGSAAEGVFFSVPKPPDDADPVVSGFKRRYAAKYGVSPGVCSDTGYDALRIIASAFDQGAHTGPEIRMRLTELRNFPGAAGSTTFDSHGDVVRPFVFKAIRGGTSTPLP